jgi:hypothetical protein
VSPPQNNIEAREQSTDNPTIDNNNWSDYTSTTTFYSSQMSLRKSDSESRNNFNKEPTPKRQKQR